MKRQVSDWMTSEPFTIDDEASVMEAMHVLKKRGVRHLPVVRRGRLVGVVTDRMVKDFAPGKATSLDTWEVHYLLSKTPVSDVMMSDPPTVKPDASFIDAAKLIRDQKLYGLCVVNGNGELEGILTIKDLLDALFYFVEERVPVGA